MHFPTLFTNPTTAGEWAILLVLNVGAVYRLSRVVARDSILEKPRHYITGHYRGALVTLLTCMWCLSFWFACVATVLTAWDTTRPWWLLAATVLTLSAFTGLLSEVA
jgi:hypothetical protein